MATPSVGIIVLKRWPSHVVCAVDIIGIRYEECVRCRVLH